MRETRHLCVGNLPENTREDKITEYFKRYGRIDKVKILSKPSSGDGVQAIVAFVDIRSAQKAQNSMNMWGDKQLQTNYSEPAAMSSSTTRQSEASPPAVSSRHSSSNSSHRYSLPYRGEASRSFDGHGGSDRHRPLLPNTETAKSQEHPDAKNKAYRDSKNLDSRSRIEKKSKSEVTKMKKAKKGSDDSRDSVKKAGKQSKHKASRGRSPTVKQKLDKKTKKQSSSSVDEEEGSSSSYSSATTGRSTSGTSASSSASSSRTNSNDSSSSRSTGESDQEGGGQKLVTIIIKKLPTRPSVNSLREGIYHEFKKCGKVKSVVIRGDNNNRHALVLFRNGAEANKAVNHSKTKLLFGAAIEVGIYEGEVSGKELQECGGIIDEFHPRSSRTLFIGNLDKTVGYSDIQNIFVRFGDIVAIEIKKQNYVPQYAFLQYTDIASVVKAIQKMDGEKLGKNTLKLGFGKTVVSSCVWVEGVTDSFTEHYLASVFQKHGTVEYIVIDRNRGQALVFYPKYEHAQQALNHLRGRKLNGSRLKLDYASQELVELFLTEMQKTGQTATTFESIRHLLLPVPSTPTAPPTPSSGSRSSRSGGAHPYIGTPDTYYEPRYSSSHPGFELGAPPPRGEWRSWEERGRSRPAMYPSISPRGRRHDDDRHEDYYIREDERFPDRVLPAYEPDYRPLDFARREHRDYGGHPAPRSYGEDYHRAMKSRDRRDPLYHSRSVHSPARILRRSRSLSPRSTTSSGRSRAREFDPKSEMRYHDHREVSTPRCRSPARSPAPRDGRGSGSDSYSSRKYRADSRYASPYSRRGDERRTEPREKQEEGPRTGSSSAVRSKVVQDAHGAITSWTPGATPPDCDDAWVTNQETYDRSRSETPTRDENLGSIGEVIIKQPVSSSGKRDEERRKSSDSSSLKGGSSDSSKLRASSQESQARSDREDDTKSTKTPDSSNSKSHSARVRSSSLSPPQRKGDRSSKKLKTTSESAVSDGKWKNKSSGKSSSSSSDSDSNGHVTRKDRHAAKHKDRPCEAQRSGSQDSARVVDRAKLIKREYSPARGDSSAKRDVIKGRVTSVESQGSRSPADGFDNGDLKSKHVASGWNAEEPASDASKVAGKKRRRSEASSGDHEHRHAERERRTSQHEHRHHHLPRSESRESDTESQAKTSKRQRRASLRHDAPMSVASQSYMDEIGDDDVVEAELEQKSPSSQFRSKITVKEEVIEIEPEADVAQDEDASLEVDIEAGEQREGAKEAEEQLKQRKAVIMSSDDRKPRTAVKVIAQPFLSSFNPYADAALKVTTPSPSLSGAAAEERTKVEAASEEKPKEKREGENLNQLEMEKARLETLLSKLDGKQQLKHEEAGVIADIVLGNMKKMKQEKSDKAITDQEVKPTASVPKRPEIAEKPSHREEQIELAVTTEPDVVALDPVEVIQEEETIVEEEVTSFDENITEMPVEIPIPTTEGDKTADLDMSKGCRKQMEEKRLKKEQKKKEKEQRSLLRKQFKEKERHKKRVEQMRVPGQKVVCSIDEEEMEEVLCERDWQETDSKQKVSDLTLNDIASAKAEKTPCDVTESADNKSMDQEAASDAAAQEQADGDPSAALQEADSELECEPLEASRKLELASQEAHNKRESTTSSDQPSHAIGRNAEDSVNSKKQTPISDKSPVQSASITKSKLGQSMSNSRTPTQNLTPNSASSKSAEDAIRMAPPSNKTPLSASPYTPRSASSHDKSSHASRKSSSSDTSSPSHAKRRPHPHPDGHHHSKRDKHGQRTLSGKPHPNDAKRRKVDHHPARQEHKRKRSPPRIISNLTVAPNASASEPLGKKELETLRAELETMKSQLKLDMSPGYLSPSTEEESTVPMSPILKSPTAERCLSAMSEMTSENRPPCRGLPSPSILTSPLTAAGSTNLTERLKLLGKVRKKTRLDDPVATAATNEDERLKELKKKPENQRQMEFRNSRLIRSSIFDQDLARLSHLQQSASNSTKASLSNLGHLDDLPADKPLFSSLVGDLHLTTSTGGGCNEQLVNFANRKGFDGRAKNANSLSSDTNIPAPAESSAPIAGRRSATFDTDLQVSSPANVGETTLSAIEDDRPEAADSVQSSDAAAAENVSIKTTDEPSQPRSNEPEPTQHRSEEESTVTDPLVDQSISYRSSLNDFPHSSIVDNSSPTGVAGTTAATGESGLETTCKPNAGSSSPQHLTDSTKSDHNISSSVTEDTGFETRGANNVSEVSINEKLEKTVSTEECVNLANDSDHTHLPSAAVFADDSDGDAKAECMDSKRKEVGCADEQDCASAETSRLVETQTTLTEKRMETTRDVSSRDIASSDAATQPKSEGADDASLAPISTDAATAECVVNETSVAEVPSVSMETHVETEPDLYQTEVVRDVTDILPLSRTAADEQREPAFEETVKSSKQTEAAVLQRDKNGDVGDEPLTINEDLIMESVTVDSTTVADRHDEKQTETEKQETTAPVVASSSSERTKVTDDTSRKKAESAEGHSQEKLRADPVSKATSKSSSGGAQVRQDSSSVSQPGKDDHKVKKIKSEKKISKPTEKLKKDPKKLHKKSSHCKDGSAVAKTEKSGKVSSQPDKPSKKTHADDSEADKSAKKSEKHSGKVEKSKQDHKKPPKEVTKSKSEKSAPPAEQSKSADRSSSKVEVSKCDKQVSKSQSGSSEKPGSKTEQSKSDRPAGKSEKIKGSKSGGKHEKSGHKSDQARTEKNLDRSEQPKSEKVIVQPEHRSVAKHDEKQRKTEVKSQKDSDKSRSERDVSKSERPASSGKVTKESHRPEKTKTSASGEGDKQSSHKPSEKKGKSRPHEEKKHMIEQKHQKLSKEGHAESSRKLKSDESSRSKDISKKHSSSKPASSSGEKHSESSSKSSSKKDRIKHELKKEISASGSSESNKSSSKPKHSKLPVEPDQPAPKKPRKDESKKSMVGKKPSVKASKSHASDAETTSDASASKASGIKSKHKRSRALSSDSESDSDMPVQQPVESVKKEHKEVKKTSTPPRTERRMIYSSDESDSSDNYDDFISKMNAPDPSKSWKPATKKVAEQQPIYTSSDESEDDDSSVSLEKQKSKPIVHKHSKSDVHDDEDDDWKSSVSSEKQKSKPVVHKHSKSDVHDDEDDDWKSSVSSEKQKSKPVVHKHSKSDVHDDEDDDWKSSVSSEKQKSKPVVHKHSKSDVHDDEDDDWKSSVSSEKQKSKPVVHKHSKSDVHDDEDDDWKSSVSSEKQKSKPVVHKHSKSDVHDDEDDDWKSSVSSEKQKSKPVVHKHSKADLHDDEDDDWKSSVSSGKQKSKPVVHKHSKSDVHDDEDDDWKSSVSSEKQKSKPVVHKHSKSDVHDDEDDDWKSSVSSEKQKSKPVVHKQSKADLHDDEDDDWKSSVSSGKQKSKPVVHKHSKSDLHSDSDHSDKSTTASKASSKHKEVHGGEKKKSKNAESSKPPSRSGSVAPKKGYSKKEKKFSKMHGHDRNSESSLSKAPKDKKRPRQHDKESETDDSSRERKPAKHRRKERLASPAKKAKLEKVKLSPKPEPKPHRSVVAKQSSSSLSSDSSDNPPPSPPSTFLTTQTIRSETLYPPDYKLSPLRNQPTSAKLLSSDNKLTAAVSSPKPRESGIRSARIYSSSDSESDFDACIASGDVDASKEKKIYHQFSSSSSSSSDSEDLQQESIVKSTSSKLEIKTHSQKSSGKLESATPESKTMSKPRKDVQQPKESKNASSSGSKHLKTQTKPASDSKSSKRVPKVANVPEKVKSHASDSKTFAKRHEHKPEKQKGKTDATDKNEDPSTGDRPKHDSRPVEKKLKPSFKSVEEGQASGKPLAKQEQKSKSSPDVSKKLSSKSSGKSEKQKKRFGEMTHSSSANSSKQSCQEKVKKADSHEPHKPKKQKYNKLHKDKSSSALHRSAEAAAPSHGGDVTGEKWSEISAKASSDHQAAPKVQTSSSKNIGEKAIKAEGHKPSHTSRSKSPSRIHSKTEKNRKLKEVVEKSENPSSPVCRKEERADEVPPSEENLPGSTFFLPSNESDQELTGIPESPRQVSPPHHLEVAETKAVAATFEEDKWHSPKKSSSPVASPGHSIFSPLGQTAIEEGESEAECFKDDPVPEEKSPSALEETKQVEEVDDDSPKIHSSAEPAKPPVGAGFQKEKSEQHRSRDSSPVQHSTLEAIKKIKTEQARQRKQKEHEKQLIRQRDEEAVRSIMGGDDAFVASTSDVDFAASDVSYKSDTFAEQSYEPTPATTESEGSVDMDVAKVENEEYKKENLTTESLEPRSTAEEVELAAAVSSIECMFGDFVRRATPEPPYHPQAAFESSPKAELTSAQSPPHDTETPEKVDDEAAQAASLLIKETKPGPFASPIEATTRPERKSDVFARRKPSESSEELILPSIKGPEPVESTAASQKPPRASPKKPEEVREREKQPKPFKPTAIPSSPTPLPPFIPESASKPAVKLPSDASSQADEVKTPRCFDNRTNQTSIPKTAEQPVQQLPTQPPTSPLKLTPNSRTKSREEPSASSHVHRPPARHTSLPQSAPSHDVRPFVPTSVPAKPEQHHVEPAAVKEVKQQPSHLGVHQDLPKALPPTRWTSKDLLPTAVAVERKNPPGVGHVHAIASPQHPGIQTNPVNFFLSPQHALVRPTADPHPVPYHRHHHPAETPVKQENLALTAKDAPSNSSAHASNIAHAFPTTFKYPVTSVAVSSSASRFQHQKPYGYHPFATNKPSHMPQQPVSYCLPGQVPTPVVPSPLGAHGPSSQPSTPTSQQSPIPLSRAPPVSPRLTSPNAMKSPALSSPTVPPAFPPSTARHSTDTSQVHAPAGQTPVSLYSPTYTARPLVVTTTTVTTSTSKSSDATLLGSSRAPYIPSVTTIATTTPKHAPTSQANPYQSPLANPSPYISMMPFQHQLPGQHPSLFPPSVLGHPGIESQSAASQPMPIVKSEPKPVPQQQMPQFAHQVFYPSGVPSMIYPGLTSLRPGVPFPRHPYGFMSQSLLPGTLPAQTARSTAETMQGFQNPQHSYQVPPLPKSPQLERNLPQTSTTRGRSTPSSQVAAAKPPTASQSPHVPSSPSTQSVAPQQPSVFTSRPPDPRYPPASDTRAAVYSSAASMDMVAQHFRLSGVKFPTTSTPHHAVPQSLASVYPRTGMPSFPQQVFRPEVASPNVPHHLAMSQAQSSVPLQMHPHTSVPLYLPPDAHHLAAPIRKQSSEHHPRKPDAQIHLQQQQQQLHQQPPSRPPPSTPKQPAAHHIQSPIHHPGMVLSRTTLPASYHQQPSPHHPQSQTAQRPQTIRHAQPIPPHVLAHQPHPAHQLPPTSQPVHQHHTGHLSQSQHQRQVTTHKPQPGQQLYRPPYMPTNPGQALQGNPAFPPGRQEPETALPEHPSAPAISESQETEPQASLEDIFVRYPIVWQGMLALKNDGAAVQIHYVCGDMGLAKTVLPKTVDQSSDLAMLRITRRMRLSPPQLNGISARMGTNGDFCLLLALPCGRDKDDVVRQTDALKSGFIEYLQQKQVAGIAESSADGSENFVLHIFPPCHFTNDHLHERAPDLLSNVVDIHHLMIVIATQA